MILSSLLPLTTTPIMLGIQYIYSIVQSQSSVCRRIHHLVGQDEMKEEEEDLYCYLFVVS